MTTMVVMLNLQVLGRAAPPRRRHKGLHRLGHRKVPPLCGVLGGVVICTRRFNANAQKPSEILAR